MARRHAQEFLDVLKGEGFAKPNPRPMFPNPPGLLRVEPHSDGLRDRIWWGAATDATAVWAAQLGMNLQSSTLKFDETGEPLHIQQRKQIEAYRAAWKEAGHTREPRISVSRSIFALVDDRDRAFFGHDRDDRDKIGWLDETTRAVFGRSYAEEPDVLVKELAAGRSDRRGRHAAADRPQPARRGIQRARHREHPQVRGPGPGLALTRGLVDSVAVRGSFRIVPPKRHYRRHPVPLNELCETLWDRHHVDVIDPPSEVRTLGPARWFRLAGTIANRPLLALARDLGLWRPRVTGRQLPSRSHFRYLMTLIRAASTSTRTA